MPTPAEKQLIDAAKDIVRTFQRDDFDVGGDAKDRNSYTIFNAASQKQQDELMKLAKKDVKCKRAVGAMVGMAVGDATGAPLEFLPVGKKGSRFDPKSLKVIGEYNKFDLKPGQWTDDTAMGLCMADSLLIKSGYDGADIRVRFWNWWNRGYNNAFRNDTSRSKSVGLGENIRASLFEIRDRNPPARFEVDGAEDSGNGSLMRLAPIPIFFRSDLTLSMQVAAESSFTTHPGPIAADACAFLSFLTVRAIERPEIDRGTAAMFLDESVKAYMNRAEVASQPILMQLLNGTEPRGSTELCWNWRDSNGPYIKETLEARGRSYNGYPVSEGYFGAYSMDGLAIAMHSFYHTKTFLDAITKCVNFLGDADSTAAMWGHIAGAF
jgi:ADP-ribosyl-[dinitrogen reductase] hydrolase